MTFGILTSGGDSPGMNAVIRSVVRSSEVRGIKVKGFIKGYKGLLENEYVDLDIRSVSDILQRGGTMLNTSRCEEIKTPEGLAKAVQNCKVNEIDGLIVIGGDGTFLGGRALSLKGIPCIGIPATIDNDIPSTDYTIGFDTAMNTVVELVDKIRDTTRSHERCSVIEVMGNGSGALALQCGIAVGATSVIIPEKIFDPQAVIGKILETKSSGRNHFIVVASEGVCNVIELAEQIEAATKIESRATILGHIQRGGSPKLRDRVVASQMGYAAVELLKDGIGNRVIALKDNKIVNYDIIEAVNMPKKFDEDAYLLADIISS